MSNVKFQMSTVKCLMLMLILVTTFVLMSMLKSDICQMSTAYVDPWDMLNNFCFHVYAQKWLFIAENCNAFFLTAASTSPSPVSFEFIELVPS